MIQLLVKSFRLNIGAPVGFLNEVKLRKTKERLGDDFSIIAPIDGQAAFITNGSRHSIIVLAPNQITFGFDGENIIPDFNFMQDTLQTVFDTLLLDPVGPSGTQIIGNYNVTTSAMDSSFEFLAITKEELADGIKGLKGVGFRFLLDHGQDTWEYKVEPLIKNPDIWFIEAICGNNENLPLPTIIKTTKEAYEYFVGDWRRITEECLLGRG